MKREELKRALYIAVVLLLVAMCIELLCGADKPSAKWREQEYTIQKHDTLYDIAAREEIADWRGWVAAVKERNGMDGPGICEGEVITIYVRR